MTSSSLSPSRLQYRWRRADGDGRRQMIIDVAMDLLRRGNLEAVTMRQVAQRLSVGTMTLYTYVSGQSMLYREMMRCGFGLLHETCQRASTLGTEGGWRGGSMAYLQFALDHPNLYKLMFDVPLDEAEEDQAVLRSGFGSLIDKVLVQMAARGLNGDELHRRAYDAAGRFWFALHGLASLLIAGRTAFLERDLDDLLDDLLQHVAPT